LVGAQQRDPFGKHLCYHEHAGRSSTDRFLLRLCPGGVTSRADLWRALCQLNVVRSELRSCLSWPRPFHGGLLWDRSGLVHAEEWCALGPLQELRMMPGVQVISISPASSEVSGRLGADLMRLRAHLKARVVGSGVLAGRAICYGYWHPSMTRFGLEVCEQARHVFQCKCSPCCLKF